MWQYKQWREAYALVELFTLHPTAICIAIQLEMHTHTPAKMSLGKSP